MMIPSVFSQESPGAGINKVDASGRKQGVWKVYDEEHNLKYTGEFINGKPVGIFTYYYPDSQVKAIVNQLDSGKIAYAKYFHQKGNLMATGKYVNQKKDSTWLYYSEEDGALSSDEHYANTVKEGVWKTYYPDGKVAEEITYRNGLQDGPNIQYFTDGKMKMKVTFVNGQMEGPYTIYHLDGTVEVSGTFLHSNKNGTWTYFNNEGATEKKEEYDNGVLTKQDILIEPN